MTFKQYAKLVYRHTMIAAQKPRRSASSARIMQELASFVKAGRQPARRLRPSSASAASACAAACARLGGGSMPSSLLRAA
jgi:hypothetical protein